MGFGERAVDINMSYRGLIHIARLDGENIFYDARREFFMSEREAQGHVLRSNYCTLIHHDEVPKPLFIQRVKESGK